MITEGVGSHRAQYELGVLRQITLSTEPILHGIFHLIERDPLAGFDDPVGNRKRVIEDAGVGKAPHRETVEPFERARMPLALLLVFHAYFSGKHAARILIAWRQPSTERSRSQLYHPGRLMNHSLLGRG